MNQPLRSILILLLAFSTCYAAAESNSVKPGSLKGKPNMVVIYVDDLHSDQLGILGSKTLMTPNMDQLARDGMMFNQGFVTSTVCTPSRFSILTGQYASRSVALQQTGTLHYPDKYPPGGPANVHFNAFLGAGNKTIANHLSDLGYKTGLVGKWHLGEVGIKVKLKGTKPDSPEGQANIKKFYNKNTQYIKDNFGFDYVDGLYLKNAHGLKQLGYPKEYQEHNLEWISEKGLEFIEKNKNEPFFLYYASTLPHGEGSRTAKTIQNADPLLTPAGRLSKLPASGMPSRKSVIDRIQKEKGSVSGAGMLWLDDAVGALLEKLKEVGVADNTIVFFISDHGNGGKSSLYDGGIRVPYFVKWPSVVAPNSKSDQIVANIDVAPTLMEIAGTPKPDAFDGKSILPILEGTDKPVRTALFLEMGYARGVVAKDWKYIALRFPDFELSEIEKKGGLEKVGYHASTGGDGFRKRAKRIYPNHFYDFDQLYDRNKDPKEQVNLFKNPEYSHHLKEMQSLLREELKTKPHTFAEFSEGAGK